MFVAVLFVFTLFAAQLVRLQAVDAGRISAEGLEVRSRLTPLPARRGAILDHLGVPLAASVERRTVLVDQNLVADYKVRDASTKKLVTVGIDGAARALAPLLQQSESDLRTKLTGTDRGATIAKQVQPSVWRKIDDLGIPGVASTSDSLRTYPGGEPVAPLVGWVGSDGKADAASGGGGLEFKLNQTLMGTPGRAVREYSRDNLVIPMGQQAIDPAIPGDDIRLTIDNDLQFIAYEAIADQVKAMEAESGYAVVMDRQGRLRAVAQYPGFDPEDRSKPKQQFQSLPFQATFEPGSTAKVMSIGAALAEGKTTPTTVYEVPNRLKRSDPRPFRDSHDHETEHLTTAGIVAQSSNIGTILIGEQMSKETLESYYRKFGMGSTSPVRFPGESAGIFPPSKDWNETQWYTMMFGQGMAVTAVQAAGVFQTIANKGVRIPATLVEGQYDAQRRFTDAPAPEPVRVLPEQQADEMSRMLETVVSESGTAATAAIPGVRIGGKTGTAQILDEPGKYVSSFIGYAPADDPQYVVAVIVNKPGKGKPIYGGVVAGPVFKKIMAYALKHSGERPGPVVTQHYPLNQEELQRGFTPSTKAPTIPGAAAPEVPQRVGGGTGPSIAPGGPTDGASPAPGGPTDGASPPPSTPSDVTSTSSAR